MEVEKTPLADLLLVKPTFFGDSRGLFTETWQAERYTCCGIPAPELTFVQDNHSVSSRHVLRGLHFQKQFPQGKLVYITLGEVWDVAVDIRPKSPTFGKWYAATLSADNHHQLWVPPGFAHGFCVLSELAHLHYKCTDYYHPEDEATLLWDDPTLQIPWPVKAPVLSGKDAGGKTWQELFTG